MHRKSNGKFSRRCHRSGFGEQRTEERINTKGITLSEDHNYARTPGSLPDVGDIKNNEVVFSEQDVFSGRLIIDLSTLATNLRSCLYCPSPLYLHNAIRKNLHGLGGVIHIHCVSCDKVSVINIGKKHGAVFDINTKLATALVHSGIGVSQVNSLLAGLNLPTVSQGLFKRRLQEVGKAFEDVAKETVDTALEEEAGIDREIEGSVDAGWQKRGSGRAYDSLSGHCSMIGCKTGKVIGYAVRSKYCKQCESSQRYEQSSQSHDCRKNWSGSSKAMEPDMVVEILKDIQDKDIKTKAIIGDEDSATISLVKRKVNKSICKKSDRNHIRKTLSSLLYGLQKKHKTFSVRCIKYILKLFSYMLSQNVNNSEGIREGLQSLSCHPFGDHSHCQNWCDRRTDREYLSLPFGRPLSDKLLQTDLQVIFNSYIKHADKLSSLGSTQANESLNKTIASKAPKNLHLSGSANLNFRVAAGVAQKNAGQKYLIDVHRKIGVSPGNYTMKLARLRDLQSRKRKAIAATHKYKRRRMLLKQKRSSRRLVCEVKEGPTYESNIELTEKPDEGTIPDGLVIPKTHVPMPEKYTEVFFDLETTGLARTSEIVQIAASRGQESFSSYMLPSNPMSTKASEVTGIHVVNNKMFLNGREVTTVPCVTGLKQFIDFISKTSNNILIAHNCKSFDSKILMYNLKKCDLLNECFNHIDGFVDSYIMFKNLYPNLECHSQKYLVSHILQSDYNAHNAVDDVFMLHKLCLVKNDYSLAYFSCQHALLLQQYSSNMSKNLPSLLPMLEKKILSKNMMNKIAGSGLCLNDLVTLFKRGGHDGIRGVFSEVINGCVRVTKSNKIIDAVCKYVAEI